MAAAVPQPLASLGFGIYPDLIAFSQRLDAAVRGRGVLWQNKLFFFSGPQYVRFDLDSAVRDSGPNDLADFKFPAGHEDFAQGIDAAINGEGPDYRSKLYMFKGERYVRFDWEKPGKHAELWASDGQGRTAESWPGFAASGLTRVIGTDNFGMS